jgi:hypothetical protein
MTYVYAINEHQDERDVSNRNVRAGMYVRSVQTELPAIAGARCVGSVEPQYRLVLSVY